MHPLRDRLRATFAAFAIVLASAALASGLRDAPAPDQAVALAAMVAGWVGLAWVGLRMVRQPAFPP